MAIVRISFDISLYHLLQIRLRSLLLRHFLGQSHNILDDLSNPGVGVISQQATGGWE